MNITFFTTKPPRLHSGSEVRNYYLLKALSSSPKINKINKINLIYASTEAKIDDLENFSDMEVEKNIYKLPPRNLIKTLISFMTGKIPYVNHLVNNLSNEKIQKILLSSDLIILSELDSYLILSRWIEKKKIKAKILLDAHNIDHLRFKSEIYSNIKFFKILANIYTNKLKKIEISAVKNVNYIICCSLIDKVFFKKYIKKKDNIFYVPNGVNIDKSIKKNKSFSLNKSILFMGQLSYGPNIDALKYYINEIHPQIKKEIQNIELIIIGKGENYWLKKCAEKDKYIKVLGFVPDVSSYINKSTVCICPVRYGSGTRLKILEYMSAFKPVVSTSKGAEGIITKSKKNILIANNSKEFSSSVIQLLNNAKLASTIGNNGYKLVRENYNWKVIQSNFLKIVLEIL